MDRQAQRPPRETVDAGGFVVESTSDARLLAKAVKYNWEIPEAVFQAAPAAMATIMAKTSNSNRDRIAATRALATMHEQNLAQEQREAPKPEPTANTVNVNVGVGVNVISPVLADKDDAELERFLIETGSTGGVGSPPTSSDPISNGFVPALTNGKAVPFSANGKH